MRRRWLEPRGVEGIVTAGLRKWGCCGRGGGRVGIESIRIELRWSRIIQFVCVVVVVAVVVVVSSALE